jgi:predicted nucleic acid-binding Zn ribbon protein
MKPIQPIMSEVVARLVRPSPLSPEKVLFAWRMAVGPMLARVTLVRLRSDGCLLVHLQDERWRPELERAAGVVHERVTAALGTDVVREVRVVGGPEPRSARPRRPRASVRYESTGPPAAGRDDPTKPRAPRATRKKRSTR